MEFTARGARMARLAGAFGSVEPSCAGRGELQRSLDVSRQLRGMIDAHEAAITTVLESMLARGVPVDDDDVEVGSSGQGGAPDGAGGAAVGEAASAPAAPTPGPGEHDGSPGAGAPPAGDPDDGPAAGPGAGGVPGSGSPNGAHRETAAEYAARLARATWLRRLDLFAAALEAGRITTAHVDALDGVLRGVEPTVVASVLADEERLLEVAATATRASFHRYLRLRVDRARSDGGAARLERQVRESFASLGHDDDLDMHRLFVRLDPIRGQRAYTAIRRRVDELYRSGTVDGWRRGQVIAQAVVDLLTGDAPPAAGGTDLLVVVDLVTLLHGHHDATVCETGDGLPIPVDEVRELCRHASARLSVCATDGRGVAVALGEHEVTGAETTIRDRARRRAGTHRRVRDHPPTSAPSGVEFDPDAGSDAASAVLHATAHGDLASLVATALAAASPDALRHGRRARLASRTQRLGLRAMYRSCAHPGCLVRFADCFVHHVTFWSEGGATDLESLVPVCGRHHHDIHEGGRRVSIGPDRALRWHHPDGSVAVQRPFRGLRPSDRAGPPAAARLHRSGSAARAPAWDTG